MKRELKKMFRSDQKKLADVAMAMGYSISENREEASIIMLKVMEGIVHIMTGDDASNINDAELESMTEAMAKAVMDTLRDEFSSSRVHKELSEMGAKSEGYRVGKVVFLTEDGPHEIPKAQTNPEFDKHMELIMKHKDKKKK